MRTHTLPAGSFATFPLITVIMTCGLVGELMLVCGLLSGILWPVLILCHFAIISICVSALVLAEKSGVQTSTLQKFTLFTFVSGAAGALAVLLLEIGVARHRAIDLEKWYQTIAPRHQSTVTLADQILDGQLVRHSSSLPKRFESLIEAGSINQQQALLAILAAEGEKAITSPVLKLALLSDDQRIRVQAAAVAAHARTKLREAQGVKAARLARDPNHPWMAAREVALDRRPHV